MRVGGVLLPQGICPSVPRRDRALLLLRGGFAGRQRRFPVANCSGSEDEELGRTVFQGESIGYYRANLGESGIPAGRSSQSGTPRCFRPIRGPDREADSERFRAGTRLYPKMNDAKSGVYDCFRTVPRDHYRAVERRLEEERVKTSRATPTPMYWRGGQLQRSQRHEDVTPRSPWLRPPLVASDPSKCERSSGTTRHNPRAHRPKRYGNGVQEFVGQWLPER